MSEQAAYANAYAPAPPQNIEAERSVLGALMQDGRAVSIAMEMLKKEDFYVPAHQAIYEAIVNLAHNSVSVDIITLDAELSRQGTLEGVGGTGYLAELTQAVPSTANVQYYISIVLEKSTLRQLIAAASDISRNCYSQQL